MDFKNLFKSSLFKNFISIGVIQIANFGLPLLTIPYVVRIIGPELFGTISFVQSLVAYFTLFINYGFDLSATRDISQNRKNPEIISHITSEVFQTKFILLLFGCLVFQLIIIFIPKFESVSTLLWVTFLINIGFVCFPNWLFQGFEEMTKMAFFNLLIKVIFSFLILIFIKSHSDYLFVTLSTSIGQIIVGLITMIYGIHFFKIKLKICSAKSILNTLKQGFPIFASMIAISLYTITNLFILGFYATDYEVGLFSASSKLVTISASLILMPLGLTLFPHIGKLFNESVEKAFTFIRKIIFITTGLTIFISLILYLFSNEIIYLVFGNEFKEAVNSMKILACLPVIIGLNNVFGLQTMLNLKMDKEFLLITILGSLICVILNFIFVPKYGHIGSSYIWVITEIVITISSYLFIRTKHFRIYKFI